MYYKNVIQIGVDGRKMYPCILKNILRLYLSIWYSLLHLSFSFPLAGIFNDTLNVLRNVILKLIVLTGQGRFLFHS